ncbi:MAG: hypothetical protein WDA22_15300 [Bacteroidota bacterium]
MPLSVGNKWTYDSSDDTEVISVDTINNKIFYKFKTSGNNNGKILHSFYWQRVSNDTLFLLNYDSITNQYIEFIDAIFSLKENDVAQIHLELGDSVSQKDINYLPRCRDYSIKVLDKSDDVIEFITQRCGVDFNYITVYKKGVGVVKTKNDWGIELKLTDFKLN